MYVFQAAFGHLLFDEVLNRTWWIGTFLVVCGTILIGSEKQVVNKTASITSPIILSKRWKNLIAEGEIYKSVDRNIDQMNDQQNPVKSD